MKSEELTKLLNTAGGATLRRVIEEFGRRGGRAAGAFDRIHALAPGEDAELRGPAREAAERIAAGITRAVGREPRLSGKEACLEFVRSIGARPPVA